MFFCDMSPTESFVPWPAQRFFSSMRTYFCAQNSACKPE